MIRVGMFALLIFIVLLAGTAIEVSVWRECRQDHSFTYCLRVLEKR